MASRYYAYMIKCADGTIYSGYTTDPDRRVREHNAGNGAKYTRSRRPVSLAYLEELPTRSAAMSREAELKSMTRAQKLALIDEKSAGSRLL